MAYIEISEPPLLVSILLILAWRNAGYYGLDRWVLPALGVPWERKEKVEVASG